MVYKINMMHKVASVRFGWRDRLRILFGAWVSVSVEGPRFASVPKIELGVERA